jgi:hypothetical protein
MLEKHYSLTELEILTGYKLATWRKWVLLRKIPVVRFGRRIKVRESDLKKLLDAHYVPALPENGR